jgi:hypothetical protein
MGEGQSISFFSTSPMVIFGIVAVAITAGLCFVSWQRSDFARGVGLLEALRLVLVILVAVTLNQPEWLSTYQPEHDPTLAVLWDQSRSMETRDVVDADQPAADPRTRRESIEPLMAEAVWKPVSSRMNVVFEPFSSELDPAAEGTDLNGGLGHVLQKHPNLRAVVLLSDGDWNVGEAPTRAAMQLRMKGVPVYAVGIGSQTSLPDIELVSFDAPTFGVAQKAMRVPFVVKSTLAHPYDTTISLSSTSGQTVRKTIRVPAMGQIQETITYQPKQTGNFTLTMRVPPQHQERLKQNNELSAPIAIREEQLKVLVVESYPRWEYRYLRNALERDPGVEVACLLFHPDLKKVGGGRNYLKKFPTAAELNQFDVILLGDVGVGPKQLTTAQCTQLARHVRQQAAGLIFMPGFRGRQHSLMNTDLDQLYPVVLDSSQTRGWGSPNPGRFELTEAGHKSLLTKLESDDRANAETWRSLPGFQWYAPVIRARAGTQILATHQRQSNRFGRIPLIVTRTYGTGKALFMGTDGAWRWREGVEDKYHYRFWAQVARWMAYQRKMAQGQSMRLFFSPDRPSAGDVITFNANVMGVGGEPLQHGTVVVQVIAPSGKTESVRLRAGSEESWGLFSGTFKPTEAGEHRLVATCRENGASVQAVASVRGVSREKRGQPARLDVLGEIADITRGKLASTDEVRALLDHIAALPEPDPQIKRVRIWSHPLWGGMIVVLLGLFWVGRKSIGAV